MEHRTERVMIETLGHQIRGILTLPNEGYRSRLSDFLSATERDFFAVSRATVTRIDDPSASENLDFVAVGRRHVVLVTSLEPDAAAAHMPQ